MEKNPKTFTIDATDKPLGRLAGEISILLRGKNYPDYRPNVDAEVVVNIKNARKIKLTGKKKDTKLYYRHSGYLGNLKSISLGKLFEKNPAEVLRKAVFGMLPENKLRSKQLKRLKIEK